MCSTWGGSPRNGAFPCGGGVRRRRVGGEMRHHCEKRQSAAQAGRGLSTFWGLARPDSTFSLFLGGGESTGKEVGGHTGGHTAPQHGSASPFPTPPALYLPPTCFVPNLGVGGTGGGVAPCPPPSLPNSLCPPGPLSPAPELALGEHHREIGGPPSPRLPSASQSLQLGGPVTALVCCWGWE